MIFSEQNFSIVPIFGQQGRKVFLFKNTELKSSTVKKNAPKIELRPKTNYGYVCDFVCDIEIEKLKRLTKFSFIIKYR